MPSLSIIIPHCGDVATLENTILSVLEHRPGDSEIIVVHDGSYGDPYRLEDELLLVDANTSNPIALVNAGLRASRASFVCLLAEGFVVSDDAWADEPLGQLAGDCDVAALMGHTASVASLMKSSVPCSPSGFFRRRTMLAVGGWNEQVAWANAGAELAMLFARLGLPCGRLRSSAISVSGQQNRALSRYNAQERAQLAVAYGHRPGGAVAASMELLKGCLRGKLLTSSATANGLLRSSRLQGSISRRVEPAREKLSQLNNRKSPAPSTPQGLSRRAA